MKLHEVLRYPIMTEVASRILETENTIVFIVDAKATKRDIKHAVESLYDVAVVKVNTLITPRGEKKAYVKLHSDDKAVDVAIKLGII